MPRLQEQTLTESAGHKEVTDVWISSLPLAASENIQSLNKLSSNRVIMTTSEQTKPRFDGRIKPKAQNISAVDDCASRVYVIPLE